MFIDTNVLIYAREFRAHQHAAARSVLEDITLSAEPARISRQILREYLATFTRPQTWPVSISREDALRDVTEMTDTFEILEEGPKVTDNLIEICREVAVGGGQIHDANIVATMLAHGEHRLLTFNVADFRRYENRIEIVTG